MIPAPSPSPPQVDRLAGIASEVWRRSFCDVVPGGSMLNCSEQSLAYWAKCDVADVSAALSLLARHGVLIAIPEPAATEWRDATGAVPFARNLEPPSWVVEQSVWFRPGVARTTLAQLLAAEAA